MTISPVLFEIAKKINGLKITNPIEASKYAYLLRNLASVLGILQNCPELFFKKESLIDEVQINHLIMERQKAKKAKDWTVADRIRKELSEMGISLEDNGDKTTWLVTN